MKINCPKCDADISETYQPDEPDVGICGGWYCDACDLGIGEGEVDRGHEDDVIPKIEREPGEKLGTPLSELSGQPETPGYEKFKRIAKSWGYD
jgi:hypothetical protein